MKTFIVFSFISTCLYRKKDNIYYIKYIYKTVKLLLLLLPCYGLSYCYTNQTIDFFTNNNNSNNNMWIIIFTLLVFFYLINHTNNVYIFTIIKTLLLLLGTIPLWKKLFI